MKLGVIAQFQEYFSVCRGFPDIIKDLKQQLMLSVLPDDVAGFTHILRIGPDFRARPDPSHTTFRFAAPQRA
jgi:hypothetical protein